MKKPAKVKPQCIFIAPSMLKDLICQHGPSAKLCAHLIGCHWCDFFVEAWYHHRLKILLLGFTSDFVSMVSARFVALREGKPVDPSKPLRPDRHDRPQPLAEAFQPQLHRAGSFQPHRMLAFTFGLSCNAKTSIKYISIVRTFLTSLAHLQIILGFEF